MNRSPLGQFCPDPLHGRGIVKNVIFFHSSPSDRIAISSGRETYSGSCKLHSVIFGGASLFLGNLGFLVVKNQLKL